jgi:hypothetical protein
VSSLDVNGGRSLLTTGGVLADQESQSFDVEGRIEQALRDFLRRCRSNFLARAGRHHWRTTPDGHFEI